MSSIKYNFIDLNLAVKTDIEPDVLEDNEKFCLKQKKSLLQKFLLFRTCNFLLKQASNTAHSRIKLILILPKDFKFEFIEDQHLYFKRMLKRVCSQLGVVLLEVESSYKSFIDQYNGNTGESQDLKNKVYATYVKQKNAPNLKYFYKMLASKGIYKLQDNINNNIHTKLGLFVT